MLLPWTRHLFKQTRYFMSNFSEPHSRLCCYFYFNTPPLRCFLPSKIHQPQQREHQADEGQDCNDGVLHNWWSTRKAADRSNPKQCQQSKGYRRISRASPGQVRLSIVSHPCDVDWGELDARWSQGKIQFNRINLQQFQTPPPQPGMPSYLDAPLGSNSGSLTVSCSETRECVAVEASRRQQAGASSRPQHRQRKWTEAVTVFCCFVFFAAAAAALTFSDSIGPSTWAPS